MPEKGFYYHYKHDPSLSPANYAYELVGIALHSEDHTYYVAYRPLYESSILAQADVFIRPLSMFEENVVKDGQTIPRFTRITDSEIIFQLNEIKKKFP